jgi:hypothetical protein
MNRTEALDQIGDTLLGLLQEQETRDALEALGLLQPIASVVPRAKAVAVIEPAAWLEESSWTLRVGHEMEWAHVKADALDAEVKRIQEAFERACAVYGEARHLDVRITVTNASLPDDCGYDVIDHVRGNPDFAVLTDYTPLGQLARAGRA